MDRTHPLIVRQEAPFNAEPALDALVASSITDVAQFYIRSHGTVPAIDAASFSLSVGGRARRPASFSLADLRRNFEEQRIVATLQCAGNRRNDFERVASVGGVTWDSGAIGTAEWTGVRLADVLGAVAAENDASHVHLDACDEIEVNGSAFSYGVSIPMAKAEADALLVYGMNGEPLEPEHGGPLRALVPGYYGARSVKWLSAITVADRPSDNYFQRVDYKLYPPEADREHLERSDGITLNEAPINAAICEPADGSTLVAGDCTVRGYAIAGERSVERVEVSQDRGATWTLATIEPGERWSWRLWHAAVALAPGRRQLCARAWDSAAQAQPEHARALWNPKGYGNNAWHRIDVVVT